MPKARVSKETQPSDKPALDWREELRKLDADLKDGKISIEEHRRQREEVLAATSGAGAASPVSAPRRTAKPSDDATKDPATDAETKAETKPDWQSANPATLAETLAKSKSKAKPEPKNDEPDASKTAPVPPEDPGERTEKIDASSLLETSRTTTARSPADDRPTEKFRFPALAVSSPPKPRKPATVSVPIPAPDTEEDRPAAEPDDRDDHGHSPIELHDDHQPHEAEGGTRTWMFLTFGVFLVLVLIVVGVWWLGSDRSGGGLLNSKVDGVAQPAGPAQAGQPGQPNPPGQPPLEERLPQLPGKPSPNNSTMTLDKATQLGLSSQAETDALKRTGVRDVTWHGSASGDFGYTLTVARTDSPQRAQEAARALTGTLVAGGYRDAGVLSSDPNLHRLSARAPTVAADIVVYASDNYVIRFALATTPANGGRVSAEFDRAVTAVLAAVPRK